MIPSFKLLCSNINKLTKKIVFHPSVTGSGYCYHSGERSNKRNKTRVLRHASSRLLSSSHRLNNQSFRDIKRRLFSVSPVAYGKIISEEDKREFDALFPVIVTQLTESAKILNEPEVTKWYSYVLQENVPDETNVFGLTFIFGYKMLTKPEEWTPQNLKIAQIIGWCLQMLIAFFNIPDDMMDESETRHGKPCWHKNPKVGNAAFGDTIFIENGIYTLIKKYCQDQPYFLDIVYYFRDVIHLTLIGQCFDSLTINTIPKYKLDKFTMDRYKNLVKFKTSFYSIYLPIALAMYMANIRDSETHRQAENILMQMGTLLQVQNDYNDCFDEATTKKIGSDIQCGKCTWLAVSALQRCSKEQRILMEEYYGSKEPKKIACIKELYEQLSLPSVYNAYKEEAYKTIMTHIQQLPGGLNKELFIKVLDNILFQKEY